MAALLRKTLLDTHSLAAPAVENAGPQKSGFFSKKNTFGFLMPQVKNKLVSIAQQVFVVCAKVFDRGGNKVVCLACQRMSHTIPLSPFCHSLCKRMAETTLLTTKVQGA